MAGYSGTPLARKLGIKERNKVHVSGAPDNYRSLLEPLPPAVEFTSKLDRSIDIVHLFVTGRAALDKTLRSLRGKLDPRAAVWVSWPKKSAKMATDITENTVRDVALPLGFVDIKVCAVDDVWSGLKLVVRKELRSS